jgi:lipoprotein-anchoring transpeptidase ErfK/SrfK
MRRGLPLTFLLAALTASPAHGQVSVGRGCDSSPQRLGDRTASFAAYANGPVQALARLDGKRVRAFGRMNQNGVPTVFGVLTVINRPDCTPAWYRVQLPIRPNGATGFVAARSTTLYRVHTRIEVDLSKRRLFFFRDGRLVLTTTAGIGASGTPTPTGRYYVNQRLYALNPSGPYGPGGIGISAFSPVLTQWAQGGPIAVHGTDDPSSVGRAASHGCVRVANGVLRRLLRATETGAPVVIHA